MRKASFGQGKRSLLDKIIAWVRINKVKRLVPEKASMLDLGCGYNGELLGQLQGYIAKGAGRDLSVNPKNEALTEGRVDSTLPYANKSFDIVTALAIIEHVEYPETMLSESYRVLKTGGKIVITTPSLFGKLPLELMAILRIISKEEIEDHKRYYTVKSLKKELFKAGFKNVRVKHFGILWLNLIAQGYK